MFFFSKSIFSSINFANFLNLLIGFSLPTFIYLFDINITKSLSIIFYFLGASYLLKTILYLKTTSHYIFQDHGSKILYNFLLGVFFLLLSDLSNYLFLKTM